MMVTRLALALSALVAVSQGDSIVLTSDTMIDHGFIITCKFFKWTDDEGTETGEVTVRVEFDAEKGPTINEIQSVYLNVRDGNKLLLSVPVRLSSYPELPGVRRVQFTIHKDMLLKSKLILQDCSGDRCCLFTVDLNAFADTN